MLLDFSISRSIEKDMKNELSKAQIVGIEEYSRLLRQHPSLFSHRNRRIVTDRQELESYASENDVVLGLSARTNYVYFINDLVEGTDQKGAKFYHPYFRVIYRRQLEGAVNTVVLPVIQNLALGNVGDIVLVEQERHATGTHEIELPRGFGEAGVSGEENALRELGEETGYIGATALYLGSTFTDSGLTDANVSFYYVPVTAREPSRPDREETIHKVHVVPINEVWAQIATGEIRDSFTLQALAFYEKIPFASGKFR